MKEHFYILFIVFFLLFSEIGIALDKSITSQKYRDSNLQFLTATFRDTLINHNPYKPIRNYPKNKQIKYFVQTNNQDLEAMLVEGMGLGIQGDYLGAIAIFSQVIKLAPDLADAYYNRGFAYVKIGAETQAIADYDQAIFLNPDFAEAYFDRARLRYSMGDKIGSLEDLYQAANLFKKQNNIYAYTQVREFIEKLNNLNHSPDLRGLTKVCA